MKSRCTGQAVRHNNRKIHFFATVDPIVHDDFGYLPLSPSIGALLERLTLQRKRCDARTQTTTGPFPPRGTGSPDRVTC